MSDRHDERDPRPTADAHSEATHESSAAASAGAGAAPPSEAPPEPTATAAGGGYGGGHGTGHGTQPPPPPAGGYPVPQPGARKPDLVNAIAIFNVVDGILNIVYAGSVFLGISFFGLSTLGCGCLFLPLGFYPLVLGILELMYGARLLPADPRDVTPARWLAVLQILNVLLGQVVSVVGGVLTLVFLDSPEVRRWFDERAPRARRPGPGYGPDRY